MGVRREEIEALLRREAELGLDFVPPHRPPAEVSTPAEASTPTEASTAGVIDPAPPIPVGPESPTPAPGSSDEPTTTSPAASPGPPAATTTAGPSGSSEDRNALVEPEILAAPGLEELRGVLGDCRRCKLCEGRNNIVFGVGNPEADLVFVGEAPGEEEDRQGIPFVGKAGALLTDIITKGMGLSRDEVYIANVVKCRPPSNRNPQPDEIVACEPFLNRQIEIIQPKAIVTLGSFATQALLRNRIPISRQRGQWHEHCGVPVMPTFHPAYLLRTPRDKRIVWGDIKMVMERMGLELPSRRQR